MIAVLIASLSISNARYQSTLNLEYLSLIEEGQLERLKHNIAFNEKLLNEVKVDAESVCNEIICSEKHLQIIENANAGKPTRCFGFLLQRRYKARQCGSM